MPKISAQTELAELPNANDLIPVVDVSDTTMASSGTNKRVKFSNLVAGSTGTFTHSAPGAASASVGTTLGQGWANVRTAFGAVGNGVANDTSALQAALNSGWPLYFPPGDYLITAPLTYNNSVTIRGPGVKNVDVGNGGIRAKITGGFANPLLHRLGNVLNPNNTFTGTQPDQMGTGLGISIWNMVFENQHAQGSCIQVYMATAPINFISCDFAFKYRGLLLLSGFDTIISNCTFTGTWFVDHDLTESAYREAVGLLTPGHTTITGCSCQGCGTGIFAYGPNATVIGTRLEVNGYGMRLGGPSMSPGSDLGNDAPLTRSLVSSNSAEGNLRGMLVASLSGQNTIENFGAQGHVGAPGGNGTSGLSEYGVEVLSGGRSDTLRNLGANGSFSKFALKLTSGKPTIEGFSGGNDQARPAEAGVGGFLSRSGSQGTVYHAVRMPLAPAIGQAADLRTLTSFSDLQLRGLKGLDLLNLNALPAKLGGLETVTAGATTKAIAWESEKGSGNAAFDAANLVVETDPGGAPFLPAGTYYYAATLLHPRGETGLSQTAVGANYKTATVNGSQRVSIGTFGEPLPYIHRIYRGPSLGVFEGYWDISGGGTTLLDNGKVAFTGRDSPPGNGIVIPTLQEPDTNYGVIVTLIGAWGVAGTSGTTYWITSKATTGFTINFSAAAPASASVAWLLFRP